MTTLVPRMFGGLTDWLDGDLQVLTGHAIRIEDSLTDTEYTLRAELPGLQPDKDIQITVEGGILTVHAERREERQTSRRSEFRYGMMQRSVRLPDSADVDHVSARYRDGILEVTVPLTTAAPRGKRIPVTG